MVSLLPVANDSNNYVVLVLVLTSIKIASSLLLTIKVAGNSSYPASKAEGRVVGLNRNPVFLRSSAYLSTVLSYDCKLNRSGMFISQLCTAVGGGCAQRLAFHELLCFQAAS